MNQLHDRILEISKKHGLSHIGSACTAVDIIDEIYSIKKEDEPFVLSCGHAFLGLAVVLEKYYGFDAEALSIKHGTHPTRDTGDKIWCSTGSLGHGIGISCGMALADKNRNVYVLISDGEAWEGSCWEVGNVLYKYHNENLRIYMNANLWGAYDSIRPDFIYRVQNIFPNINIRFTKVQDYGFIGQEAHYVKL